MMTQLTTKRMCKDFVDQTLEYEDYVLVYSKTIQKIYGVDSNQEDSTKELEAYYSKIMDNYVCIENSEGKKIYRKCRGRNGVNSGEICIGYRSLKELGLNIGNDVNVSPCSWFRYYGCNSSINERRQFWLLFVSLMLAVVSGVISLLSLFVNLPIIH